MKLTAYRTSLRNEVYLLPTLIYRPRPYKDLGWKTLGAGWLYWWVYLWWGEAKGQQE